MDEKYPVSTLSTHIEIGEKALAECYPQIVEHNTDQTRHEVPRIIFRACLPPRLKDGEIFNFAVNDYTGLTVDDAKARLEATEFMPGSLNYVYVGKYKTLKTPVKTVLTRNGFAPNDIVNTFFEGRIERQEYKDDGDFMQIFFNEEKKIAIIVGSVTSDYFWNCCAALCPRIIPWYFGVKSDFSHTGGEHPFNEDERALARSVDIGDEAFTAAATKIYEKTDVAERVQAVKFKNAFKGVRGTLLKQCIRNLDSYNNEYRNLANRLSEYTQKIRDEYIRKQSLEVEDDDDGSSLMRIFVGRPSLAIRNWQGNDLIFTAVANLTSFADPSLEIERHGNLYSGLDDRSITFDDAKALMTSVFIERGVKIPVYSNFQLSLEHAKISVLGERHSMVATPAPKFMGYAPQPHHYYYECFGTNDQVTNDCLCKGDYAGAVSQAIGSVPYLVFSDSCVVEKYAISQLWNKAATPYLLPDGRKVNYVDAIKWLKEES